MQEKKQVIYNGEKYDITTFIDKHPGGREVIEEYINKDMTDAFDNVGHSEGAQRLLAKYKLDKNGNKVVIVKENYSTLLVKKLFTDEDRYFFHKVLGLLNLGIYFYRYAYMLPFTGSLGFDNSNFTFITFALTIALSASSLIFHVLDKRITKNPLIIYEEYRLHAILFTIRAVGISVIGILYPNNKYAIIAFMLLMHGLVDFVTYKYGTKGVTAVRNNNGGNLFIKGLRIFFSYYQFTAIASHLTVDPRLNDLGWNAGWLFTMF